VKKRQGVISKVIKCGIVGDGTVGKSCLLMTYTMNGFVEDYIPTIFDNLSVIEEFDDGRLINITLWDTAGQDDYALFRTSTCYKNTDVFLVCFSVVNPHSFQNVKQKWIPELQEHCPNVPFILVGTQTDRKNDPKVLEELQGQKPIDFKTGEKRAKEIKAVKYLECTAREISTVTGVFRAACQYLLEVDDKRKQRIAKLAKKELAVEKKYEKKMEKERSKAAAAERKAEGNDA